MKYRKTYYFMINLHLYTVIYIDNNYRYVIFFFYTLYNLHMGKKFGIVNCTLT